MAACGVVALCGASLAWRLARGPIDLARLIPYVERAVRVDGVVSGLRLETLELAWDGTQHRLELRASGVQPLGLDGVPLATIPRLEIAPRLLPLLVGRVTPARIDLIAPRLDVVQETDHRITIGVGTATEAPGTSVRRYALADILSPGGGTTTFPLDAIGIRQGVLALTRREDGARLEATDFGIRIRRVGDALSGSLHAALERAGHKLPIDVDLSYHPDRTGTTVHLGLHDLVPAALAPAVGRSDRDDVAHLLESEELPLSGTIDASIDRQNGTMRLEQVSVTLGGVTGRVTGGVTRIGDGLRMLDVHAIVRKLPIRRLGAWPRPLATDAHDWVLENITDGWAHDIDLRLRGTLDDANAFKLKHLRGRLAFDDLRVRFVDTMPPVTGVGGVGKLSRNTLGFAVRRGVVQGVAVPRARVGIFLTDPDAILALDARVRGPIRGATSVLAAEPVRLDEEIPMLTHMDGALDGRLRFRFPLRDHLSLDDLGLGARAELRDVRNPAVLWDWPLSHGTGTLTIEKRLLSVTGGARVAGVPVRLALSRSLVDEASLRLEANARCDRAARAALGLDPGPWLDGPVDVRTQVLPQRGTIRPVQLTLDLRAARLSPHGLPFDKGAGQPARAQARLDFDDGNLVAIEDALLSAGSFRASGRATRLDAGRRWGVVDARVTMPGSGKNPAQVSLTLQPTSAAHDAVVTSDDAGAVLAGVLSSRATGGTLHFSGTTDLSRPDVNFAGQLDVQRPVVTESLWLKRLAMLTSLSGMVAALSSREGLRLDFARAEIGDDGQSVTIRDGRIRTSDGIGILVAGTIGDDASTLDLRGTVIPPYFGLNTVPGRVPLLGTLYDKATGGGIGGIEFAVSGAVADPQVTIRPLATLAPGVLRPLLH